MGQWAFGTARHQVRGGPVLRWSSEPALRYETWTSAHTCSCCHHYSGEIEAGRSRKGRWEFRCESRLRHRRAPLSYFSSSFWPFAFHLQPRSNSQAMLSKVSSPATAAARATSQRPTMMRSATTRLARPAVRSVSVRYKTDGTPDVRKGPWGVRAG